MVGVILDVIGYGIHCVVCISIPHGHIAMETQMAH